MPVLVGSSNLHEKLQPTAFPIDKDPRKAVTIIRCASDARQQADGGEIARALYDRGGHISKASKRIGEVIDRDIKRRPQRFAAADDFIARRFVVDFLQFWM
jgi:hypothetical protein